MRSRSKALARAGPLACTVLVCVLRHDALSAEDPLVVFSAHATTQVWQVAGDGLDGKSQDVCPGGPATAGNPLDWDRSGMCFPKATSGEPTLETASRDTSDFCAREPKGTLEFSDKETEDEDPEEIPADVELALLSSPEFDDFHLKLTDEPPGMMTSDCYEQTLQIKYTQSSTESQKSRFTGTIPRYIAEDCREAETAAIYELENDIPFECGSASPIFLECQSSGPVCLDWDAETRAQCEASRDTLRKEAVARCEAEERTKLQARCSDSTRKAEQAKASIKSEAAACAEAAKHKYVASQLGELESRTASAMAERQKCLTDLATARKRDLEAGKSPGASHIRAQQAFQVYRMLLPEPKYENCLAKTSKATLCGALDADYKRFSSEYLDAYTPERMRKLAAVQARVDAAYRKWLETANPAERQKLEATLGQIQVTPPGTSDLAYHSTNNAFALCAKTVRPTFASSPPAQECGAQTVIIGPEFMEQLDQPGGEDQLFFLMAHEYGHRLQDESPATFAELEKCLAARTDLVALSGGAGNPKSQSHQEEARDELVADWLGTRALSSNLSGASTQRGAHRRLKSSGSFFCADAERLTTKSCYSYETPSGERFLGYPKSGCEGLDHPLSTERLQGITTDPEIQEALGCPVTKARPPCGI